MPDDETPDNDPDAPTEIDAAAAFRMGQAPTQNDPKGWSPPAPDALNPLLPDYEITALLGRGGMGAVYKAVQTKLKRTVAIKLLPPEMAQIDPTFKERFQREAEAMAAMDHPNIVTVFDFGVTSMGHSFFVMEFVDGMDFHQLIHTGQLDPAGALNAVSQICDALEYAHEQGYVHRDIKPANIFINQKGILKVGDFGLAKIAGSAQTGAGLPSLTIAGSAMGTPFYSAPEQLDGGEVDHRADIFSLGVMFYEMLTREIPRGHATPPSEKMENVDKRLDEVVFRAMESEPSARYPNVSEMRTEVDAVRTGEPNVEESVRISKGREGASSKKKDVGLILASVAIIGCAGVAIFSSSDWRNGLLSGGTPNIEPVETNSPFPLDSPIRPGEVVIVQDSDARRNLSPPTIPDGFDDIVHVEASIGKEGLSLNYVRADGSSWRCEADKKPKLWAQGVSRYVREGGGLVHFRDGSVKKHVEAPIPFDDEALSAQYRAIAAHQSLYIGLTPDGGMKWLSEKVVLGNRPTKIFEIPDGDGFQSVSIGYGHGLAVDQYGKLVGWGEGEQSEVPSDLKGLKISAALVHFSSSFAIDQYSRVHAWGNGLNGTRSHELKNRLLELFDAEELFAGGERVRSVAIRRKGNRWIVLNQAGIDEDWGEDHSAAEKLAGCEFVCIPEQGVWVGIRPKTSVPELPETNSPFPLDSPFPPGEIVMLKTDTSIGLPFIPKSLNDVVQIAPTFRNNGILELNFVRSDGTGWTSISGKPPQPQVEKKIARYVKNGGTIIHQRDGFVQLTGGRNKDAKFNETYFSPPHRFQLVTGHGYRNVGLTPEGELKLLSDMVEGADLDFANLPKKMGIRSVSIANSHGLAIDRDHHPFGWGRPSSKASWAIPKELRGLSVKKVFALHGASFLIDQYGRLHAWGRGFHGQNPDLEKAISEVFDAEECFGFRHLSSAYTVAVRRKNNRWLVLRTGSEPDRPWKLAPEEAQKLEGWHFAWSGDGVWVGLRSPSRAQIAKEVQTDDGIFPLPLPEFPPKRPTTKSRLVAIRVGTEDSPVPSWLTEVQNDDPTDLVALDQSQVVQIDFGVICLRSDGSLVSFGKKVKITATANGDSNHDYATISRHPFFPLTVNGYARFEDRLENPNVPPQTSDVAKIGIYKPTEFVALKKDGTLKGYGDMRWINNKFEQISTIDFRNNGRVAILLRSGTLFSFNKSRDLSVLGKSGEYSRLISPYCAARPDGSIKLFNWPEREEGLEFLKSADATTIKSTNFHPDFCWVQFTDGEIRFWNRASEDRTLIRLDPAVEQALKGATSIQAHQPIIGESVNWIFALLPAETVPRSGFWEIGDLITARQ